MEIGIYKGAASMAALEQWQEAISQNIAASSVPGFKKTQVSFSAIESDLTGLQPGAKASDRVQGSMPKATPMINFSQGQLSRSDNELDFAIQGSGFFQVQLPNGEMGYTRNGQFHLSPEKTLVNGEGLQVMGDSGPITFKSGLGPISINSDGTITQRDQQIAKLPAYNFADTSKLRRVGEGLVGPADSSVTPTKADKAQILNNYIENSNVSPISEMVNLVSVSRAYEASQKIVQTADDNEGKAIEVLGSPN
jgi:flagellar basal body rod protein FlgG